MYYPICILMSICSAVIFILGTTINSKKKDDGYCAREVSEGESELKHAWYEEERKDFN